MDSWKVVIGTARGHAHQVQNLPNQDAAEFCIYSEWLVAVVCDGAALAARSDVGAKHGARFVSQRVAEQLESRQREAA